LLRGRGSGEEGLDGWGRSVRQRGNGRRASGLRWASAVRGWQVGPGKLGRRLARLRREALTCGPSVAAGRQRGSGQRAGLESWEWVVRWTWTAVRGERALGHTGKKKKGKLGWADAGAGENWAGAKLGAGAGRVRGKKRGKGWAGLWVGLDC
jgi:hypothetical protein